MTTAIGRFLNAFPDWVLPFAAAALAGLVIVYGLRAACRWAGRRRTWTRGRTVCFALAAFMVAVAGTWLLVNVARPTYQAFRADGWRTAHGKVKRCRLIPHATDPRDTTWSVDFLYGFVLDGQGYEGDRFDASVHGEREYATQEAFARAYPPGTPVTIRFNPADGDDSFLSTKLPRDLFDGSAAYLVLLIAGLTFGTWTLCETARLTPPSSV